MNVERVIQVGLPGALRQRPSGALESKLRDVVELVWSELGLPSRPRVAMTDAAPGTVALDGRPVPLSARRVEQAVLAGSGAARRPGEVGGPRDLLMARLDGPDLETAASVTACLVDVALRADVAGLVRADSADGSERLDHDQPEQAPPQPVIEANVATLRRLTTHGRILRTENTALDYMKVLFSDYGVRTPAASLRAIDQPGSAARFRFGSSRTAAHLVLPDTQAVVMTRWDALPAGSGARPFIDPASGEVWSLIDLPVDATWSPDAQLDPAALLSRSLLAEMKIRLPLWSPTFDELGVFESRWFDSERLHLDEASGALRCLLSVQASVHLLQRLMEGVVTAAAEGVRGSAAIAERLRPFLGRAVLGPLTASSGYTLVEVDGPVAREAAESGSPAPLLTQYPALVTATEQLVVTCPNRWRRDVEYLLRSLSDTVVVAADEELALLPATAT